MINASLSSVISFLFVATTTTVFPLVRSSVDRTAAAINTTAAPRDITISGTIVLSFEDEFVVLQRDNTFLKIRRSSIASAETTKLEQPGANVDLHLTPGAITSAWTVNLGAPHSLDVAAAICACLAHQAPADASAAAPSTLRQTYAAQITSQLQRPDSVLATRLAYNPKPDETFQVCTDRTANRLQPVAVRAKRH